MRDWNCDLYLKFERERAQPARDLLSRIPPLTPHRIVDLGCGPGNTATILSGHYRFGDILGIDCSPRMIKAAREKLPTARFVEADLTTWTPETKVDLIYANSALHYAPDHQNLLPRLLGFLHSGGVLAVQMPNVLQDPAHALMRMVAVDGPWTEKLAPIAKSRAAIGGIDDYYAWLSPYARGVDLWQTTYVHPLEGHDALIDWFAGSALLPFLDPLDEDERAAFLAQYRRELEMAYLPQDDGKVLLHYPRLFFVAQV